MIEIRKTLPMDVAMIKPKAIFGDNPDILNHVLEAMGKSLAFTLIGMKGEVVAILGYTPIHSNAGELWSVTSDDVYKYPLSFHKMCVECLDTFVKANNLKRVQMTVKASYRQGIEWAKALGFNIEGVLNAYGHDGSDYLMMGRTY